MKYRGRWMRLRIPLNGVHLRLFKFVLQGEECDIFHATINVVWSRHFTECGVQLQMWSSNTVYGYVNVSFWAEREQGRHTTLHFIVILLSIWSSAEWPGHVTVQSSDGFDFCWKRALSSRKYGTHWAIATFCLSMWLGKSSTQMSCGATSHEIHH